MVNECSDDGFTQKSIDAFSEALTTGDECSIRQAKHELLTDTISLLGIVVNYIALEQCGVAFDFGVSRILKGTRLYRIRSYSPDINYDDPSEWGPNPKRTQGRANREKQEALYLGSTEAVCLLETHTGVGRRYALGTYECVDDIFVGGFLRFDEANELHNIAGMALNAFLIAPSRGERNTDLFEFLDGYYGKITLDDLCGLSYITGKGGLELPFRFGVLNQRNQLYEMTNALCDILAKRTPEGIRYSSCYFPMEAPGIACTDFNLALYRGGVDKLRFLGYEIKTNENPMTAVDVARRLIESAS
ncbi:RES family NAD+ phosphorylase [Adlercreutzia sp. ZJ473]|uniref:RES family NAD+ phosphorylase n=1 Tax=Adlercreutzia sp. ZJ473 TaxID=2722822 RepID=UPI001555BC68|nr:RES family NAD+ phosphorylase [Adlercreutzia sp. ZJ473]